jgi:outer membrane lipoprotein-sorting protein
VDETDTQKGVIYFRRQGKDTDMAADVKTPEPKYVLFADGKLRLYQPRIDQVTEYDVGKKRADVESFLVLGFGGRGHDLLRSFNVKLLKRENVDGVNTAVLELTPTTPSVRNMFNRMLLWIDPALGVSRKQQFFEPSEDYRLARYLNIKVDQKVKDEVFKLKTTPSTKTVTPQG